jgi:TRAP-type transport system periplasmic protein
MKTNILAWIIYLACAASSFAASKKEQVKFATIVPQGMSYHNWLKEMTSAWTQELADGTAITIFPGATMGGEPSIVSRMRSGALEGALVSATGLAEIDPYLGALQYVPLLFENWDEIDYVREQISAMLEERLLAKGYVLLFWADGGWVRFFSKKPVSTPEDLKQLRLFVSAGSGSHSSLMKSLGYRPISLEPADVRVSLGSGMLDVAAAPPFFANANQYVKETKYMIDLKWAPIVGGCIMRKEAWEKFPAAKRAKLKEVAERTGRQIRGQGREEDVQSIAAMRKHGLQVIQPNEQQLAGWVKAKAEIHAAIRGELLPAEMFDLIVKHHTDYRARKSAGN